MKSFSSLFQKDKHTKLVTLIVVLIAAFMSILIGSPLLHQAEAAEKRYPGVHWEKATSPEKLGYSSGKLQEAQEYTKSIKTAAVMIIVDGAVLAEWGEITARFNVHSIRKSFLSALYGIHVNERRINLSWNMKQLGIDDNEPSLTEVEKQATIRQLLKARSGVYHPALYESPGMKASRPERHSHAPGTFWYYNNWDFNVLGTIFRNRTRTDIFREFKRRIADPIGMEDYKVSDGHYFTGRDSVYPAYPFRMTTRDMARFGLLFLRNGRWKDKQIISSEWVKESTTSYSDAGGAGGYGYLWWITVNGRHLPGVSLEDGAYSARGAGGHYILIIPSFDMVIVHRVNTYIRGNRVLDTEFGRLVRMILDSKIQ